MTATATTVFNAPHEFEAALQARGSFEVIVTGLGQFQAKLTQLLLPRLCLLHCTERLSRIAVASVPHDAVLVIVPYKQCINQAWGGFPMQADEIITVGPAERVHARTSGPCLWGAIWVSATELAQQGIEIAGPGFKFPAGVRRWRPTRTSMDSLTTLFEASIRLSERRSGVPIEPQLAHRLEMKLIHSLIECFRTGPLLTNRTATQRHVTLMTRLDDVLQTYSNRIPLVSEICIELGISQRALLACCREQVGLGPSSYFRLGKMRRVHHALISAQPDSASVSHLVKSHGFRELGRFASVYRKLFGELPSATLRRRADLTPRP
jgi:AraC-like DNA-binding protein